MSTTLGPVAALFGDAHTTLDEYIETTLGAAADDYDLEGIESDLLVTIGQVLPDGVRMSDGYLMADAGDVTLEDVREAVGWVDVWTIAPAHDTAGPGA